MAGYRFYPWLVRIDTRQFICLGPLREKMLLRVHQHSAEMKKSGDPLLRWQCFATYTGALIKLLPQQLPNFWVILKNK